MVWAKTEIQALIQNLKLLRTTHNYFLTGIPPQNTPNWEDVRMDGFDLTLSSLYSTWSPSIRVMDKFAGLEHAAVRAKGNGDVETHLVSVLRGAFSLWDWAWRRCILLVCVLELLSVVTLSRVSFTWKRNKLAKMAWVTRLGWGGCSEKNILGFGKEEGAQGVMIKGNWVFVNGSKLLKQNNLEDDDPKRLYKTVKRFINLTKLTCKWPILLNFR